MVRMSQHAHATQQLEPRFFVSKFPTEVHTTYRPAVTLPARMPEEARNPWDEVLCGHLPVSSVCFARKKWKTSEEGVHITGYRMPWQGRVPSRTAKIESLPDQRSPERSDA